MAKKQKPVVFLGSERPWDEVYEYYTMIVDAYNDYCDSDEKLTPSRKQYLLSFKGRVDSVALLLGLPSGAFLPKGMDKNYVKPVEEEQENTNEEEHDKQTDEEKPVDKRTEGIPVAVRKRKRSDTKED